MFILSLFLIYSLSAEADPKVSAFVDKPKVSLNDSLTFTIQIELQDEEPDDLIFPKLSELRDFDLLGQRPGIEQSISFVNGKMIRKKNLTRNYNLQPKTQGRFQLGPFDVQIDGKTFKTKEVSIEVTIQAASPSPPPSQPFFPSPFAPGFKDLFSNPFQRTKKALIKFQLFLNREKAYLGEMILADWVFFSSVEKIRAEPKKIPTLKGFWKKELLDPSAPTVFLGTEVIDDVLYRKELLTSYALFPVETGDLVIDSYIAQFTDLSDFFGREITKSTPSRRLSVKPLPLEGRGNFSGAVGDFSVQASLSETETQTGQPLSYKLRFEGQGSIRDIQPPNIPFPLSLKTYPPAEKSHFSPEKSRKEFEFLIIPQKVETVTTPSFPLTTFHPESGAYRNHAIPSLSFKVTKGANDPPAEDSSFFGSNDKKTQEPKEWKMLKEPGFFIFNQISLLKFWTVFYTILMLAFSFLYLIRRMGWAKISFEEKLEMHLKKIQKLVNKKQTEKAAVSLINLIYRTVSDLTQGKESPQEWQKMIQALPPSLHRKFAEPLTTLIQELEALSFAPRECSPLEEQVKPLLERTQALLRKIVASRSRTGKEND